MKTSDISDAQVVEACRRFHASPPTARETFPGFNMSPKDEIIGEMLTLLLSAGRRWARSDAADARALRDLVLTGYGLAANGGGARG